MTTIATWTVAMTTKANWIENKIVDGATDILFLDDSGGNVDAVLDLKERYPNVKIDARVVNNAEEIKENMAKLKEQDVTEINGIPIQKYEEILIEDVQEEESKTKKSLAEIKETMENILVDMNNSSVNLIDWETFEKSGSPFYDIGKFVYHVLTPDSRTKFQLDLEMEEFVRNTKNIKNHQLLEKLNMILTEYFGNTINLIIVLRYYFIKDLAMNPNINKPYFIKLLKELKNIN